MVGGTGESPLEKLIDCLDPPPQPSAEAYAHLEKIALVMAQKQPALLAQHSPADNNITPLMAAVMSPDRCCSVTLFSELLKLMNPTDLNAVKDQNLTVLHFLAMYNRYEHLQALLAIAGEKLQVNAQTLDGSTALHCAAFSGAVEMVSLLTVTKADVNVLNLRQQSPLHIACFFGQAEGGKQAIPISREKAEHYADCIQLLLLSGAKVNERDQFGSTPVHCLMAADIPDDIKFAVLNKLIEHGADLQLKANNHYNAVSITEAYEFHIAHQSIKQQIVPSLKILAAKKVLATKQVKPHSLFDDLAEILQKLRLGKGKKN